MNPEIPLGPDDKALLIRYYAGMCDAAERSRAKGLIARLPNEQFFAEAFQRTVVHGTPELTANELVAAIEAWRERVATGAQSADGKGVRSARTMLKGMEQFRNQSLPLALWSTVAVLVCAIVVVMLGWTAGVRHTIQRAAASTLTHTTGEGQQSTIILPDGSKAVLDVASRLEIPADYATGDHAVRLTGEALFTVTHHDGTPFTVSAGGTTAQVLGTSFLVRHYPSDSTTTVAVQDGRVAVGSLVLTAARMVEVDRAGMFRAHSADASLFSFATGVLKFNGEPLSSAIPELDRWYKTDIRIGDPALATRRITGGFTAGSLSDLTELLELTFGVRVVRDGRVITLYQR